MMFVIAECPLQGLSLKWRPIVDLEANWGTLCNHFGLISNPRLDVTFVTFWSDFAGFRVFVIQLKLRTHILLPL